MILWRLRTLLFTIVGSRDWAFTNVCDALFSDFSTRSPRLSRYPQYLLWGFHGMLVCILSSLA